MLLAAGYGVRIYDAMLFGVAGVSGLESAAIEIVKGDIRDAARLTACARGCECIIHLAAIVGDTACQRSPALSREVNVDATNVVIGAASAASVGRVVLASSCSVYGASGAEVVTEADAPRPVSLYAETRVEAEQLLLASPPGLGAIVLRLGTLFGWSARMRFDLAVNRLAARAKTAGDIAIFGNGQQWRPFLHVQDAATAFVTAMRAPLDRTDRSVFNVGNAAMNHRMIEVGHAIRREFPKARLTVNKGADNDERSYRVSFDRITTDLGFTPNRTIAAGIHELNQQLDAHPEVDYLLPIYRNA
jgi:nucleoside-diphosphate-sugar epimerase